MKPVIAVALAVAGTSAPSTALCESVPPPYVSARAYFHAMRAEQLRKAQDREGAIEAYESALVYDPDSYHLHVVLASFLIEQGEASRAHKLIEHALQLSPKRIEAHRLRARLLLAGGESDDAESVLRAAIALGPTSNEGIRASIDLARLLGRQGRGPEAGHILQRTVRTPSGAAPSRPALDALVELALIEAELGRPARGLAALSPEVALGSIRARLMRAELLALLGRTQESARAMNALATERPNDLGVVLEALRAELRDGRLDRAGAYLSIVPPEPAARRSAAEVLRDEGQPALALALLKKVASDRVPPAEIEIALVSMAIASGDKKAALSLLEAGPKAALLGLWWLRLHGAVGDLSTAADQATPDLKAEALAQLGDRLLEAGELEAAREAFGRALTEDRDQPLALARKIELAKDGADLEQATETGRQSLDRIRLSMFAGRLDRIAPAEDRAIPPIGGPEVAPARIPEEIALLALRSKPAPEKPKTNRTGGEPVRRVGPALPDRDP
jgi:tetratricopeptide (TPR) repeat protein